jgi:hypothetical protein
MQDEAFLALLDARSRLLDERRERQLEREAKREAFYLQVQRAQARSSQFPAPAVPAGDHPARYPGAPAAERLALLCFHLLSNAIWSNRFRCESFALSNSRLPNRNNALIRSRQRVLGFG